MSQDQNAFQNIIRILREEIEKVELKLHASIRPDATTKAVSVQITMTKAAVRNERGLALKFLTVYDQLERTPWATLAGGVGQLLRLCLASWPAGTKMAVLLPVTDFLFFCRSRF